MKAVIQRVSNAEVHVNGALISSVQKGFLVLLGVHNTDTEEQAKLLASKTANLRIFCDEFDKMNKSVLDVGGEILVISNFTLCADCSHGRRPEFTSAAPAAKAEEYYNKLAALLGETNKVVCGGNYNASFRGNSCGFAF